MNKGKKKQKEKFVLIPLNCLRGMWEKDWAFSTLFRIGVNVSLRRMTDCIDREMEQLFVDSDRPDVDIDVDEETSKYDVPPYILVSVTIIKNFVALDRYTTDMHTMQRIMYLGIASIVGKNTFVYTTSDMIKARMFGFLNQRELKEYYDEPSHEGFRKLYDKYSTRRRYDNMMMELQMDQLICEVCYKRRTVISLRIKNVIELLETVKAASQRNKRKELIETKKAALEQLRKQPRKDKLD